MLQQNHTLEIPKDDGCIPGAGHDKLATGGHSNVDDLS